MDTIRFMPSFTFSSTANAFALRGATVVFADIEPDTMKNQNDLFRDGWEQVAAGNLQMLQHSSIITSFFIVLILTLTILLYPLTNLLAALTAGLLFQGCMAVYVRCAKDTLRWRPRVIHALCIADLVGMPRKTPSKIGSTCIISTAISTAIISSRITG